MRISMFTNVYRPKVGGVTNSIDAFAERIRAAGHRVQIVAPSFRGEAESEPDVVRIASVHNILQDYSLPLGGTAVFRQELIDFAPDVVHAHHPFLLGSTAHKFAATVGVPVVYTHHTRFDAYGSYFPIEHGFLQNFVVYLSVEYANLCDAVVAPGTYVKEMLTEAGVTTPIRVLPTGVDVERFADGDGRAARQRMGIPEEAPLIGTVCRLAAEKNLLFLIDAVVELLTRHSTAHYLLVGHGAQEEALRKRIDSNPHRDRIHLPGVLVGQELVDAYHAMDLFAFASKSETQGMVITEAMAAGTPVVALHASGVEDVLESGKQGILVGTEETSAFANALEEVIAAPQERRQTMQQNARSTAQNFSIDKSAVSMMRLYQQVIAGHREDPTTLMDLREIWEALGRRVQDDLRLFEATSKAVRQALTNWSFD